MTLLDTFDQEIAVEYDGERYLVRDNGAVLRKKQPRSRERPNDNTWSFGNKSASSGYMIWSGVRVHRIVCTAFNGVPRDHNLVVDHIDTNRQNNRPENLRWITRLENIIKNPITLKRIILAYGSLDAFFENPSAFKQSDRTQNIEWMRTVSKEEAAQTLRRLLDWSKSGSLFGGRELGEWIYSQDKSNTLNIPKQQEEQFFESYTPTALQVEWRTKTTFPLCPTTLDQDALEQYQEKMRFGEVFSENQYARSIIVQAGFGREDRNSLVAITRFDGLNPVKSWGVVNISMDENFIYHKNVGTYFELKGALKEYCLQTGDDYEIISIDDYS